MRKIYLFLMLVLLVAGLAGCREERKSTPTQLDAPFTGGSPQPVPDDVLPVPSATLIAAQPTAILTPTLRPTPLASATPYPTPDPDKATAQPLDNYILPAGWIAAPFADATGAEHTFEDFLGRGVIVHLLSASCSLCVEQHAALAAGIQDRLDNDLLPDTVFVALGVNERETPSLIEATLRRELGTGWSALETIQGEDVPADWLAAVAGPRLLDELARSFGPAVLNPNTLAVIVIQPDGLAHLYDGGLAQPYTFRDLITFYGNPINPADNPAD